MKLIMRPTPISFKKLFYFQTLLCPKLLLVCKFCERDVPASEMSGHEGACGDSLRECPRCGEAVPLREWERHMSAWHGLTVQRSPGRQRKQSSTQGTFWGEYVCVQDIFLNFKLFHSQLCRR